MGSAGTRVARVLPSCMTLRRHHSVNPEAERMERWFVRPSALDKQGVDEDTFV